MEVKQFCMSHIKKLLCSNNIFIGVNRFKKPLEIYNASTPEYTEYNVGFTLESLSFVRSICVCNEINIANLTLPQYGVWMISFKIRFESTHGFSIITDDIFYLKSETKILQIYENIIPRVSNNTCTISNSFIYVTSNNELNILLTLCIKISRHELCCDFKIINDDTCNQYHLRATRIA